MRDRVLLGLAVVLLIAGLSAWIVVSPTAPDDDRALLLASTDPPPPIGEPVRSEDVRAREARAALEAVSISPSRIHFLADRAGTPVFGLTVPGRDAVSVYDALLGAQARTGLLPVLLGDGHSVAEHIEAMRTTRDTPESIVRRAQNLDIAAWVAAHLGARAATAGTPREADGETRERFPAIGDPLLALPLFEIGVMLVPAAHTSEAPAWLAYGNFRDCPEPTTHVAILEHLRARVAAEVVAIAAERIDLRIGAPPTDAAERRALAELLVAYAPRVLVRPSGAPRTIEDVAAEVVPSRVWSLEFPRP